MLSGNFDKRMRNIPLADVFKNEGSAKSIDLKISYTRIDPVDEANLKEIKCRKKIVKLGVYNLPCIHGIDPGRKAHPSMNPLLTFLDYESHKLRSGLVEDSQFNKNSRNIQEAICDSYYVYSYIKDLEIEIQPGKSPISILIDGRLYGDF